MQVLGQHDQAVPEVQVGLARTAVAQRATTDVEHLGLAGVADVPAPAPQAPAQVDLLHVREEVGIEATSGMEGLGTDHQAGPGGPEHLALIVVLPMVLLGDLEDAPSAEGVAVAVDEATCGPGMFEAVRFVHGKHFRLACRRTWVAGPSGRSIRARPALGHLHVGVQQDDSARLPPGARLRCNRPRSHGSPRVRSPVLLGVVPPSQVKESSVEPLSATMTSAFGAVFQHNGQEAFEPIPAVPIQDDDCGVHA